MKYFAEHLSNLDYIALYVESDSSLPLELRQLTPRRLIVAGSGFISQTVELPAALNEAHMNIPITTGQIKLKPKTQYPDQSSAFFGAMSAFKPPICGCNSPLVRQSKWKQLPSEHWAELMDLWHCHKPSDNDQVSRGIYELAMNGFHPVPGLAYYSETYYLVHAEDILASAHAEECAILSRANTEKTLKLWKWDLDSKISVSSVIFSMLCELVDSHAVFTFTVNSDLILWVLNISSSVTFTGVQGPLEGAKVLYGDANALSATRPDAEAIEIPAEAFKRLLVELENVNQALPKRSRVLGKWKLGFLGKETITPTEGTGDTPL